MSAPFEIHAYSRQNCPESLPGLKLLTSLLQAIALLLCIQLLASASDHGDGHIGDFYAFEANGQLVMVMTITAEIPEHHEDFRFSSDFSYNFFIDNDSEVRFNNQDDLKEYGGTLVDPSRINEDITIKVQFPKGEIPMLAVSGLGMGADTAAASVLLYTGVRDEPFIRRTVVGKNIAAIIVQVPLHTVVARPKKEENHLLLWAATFDNARRMHDICGRSYRSQQPENLKLNTLHPSKHMSDLKMVPDVLIYNTGREAIFPNGRKLEDDVVDILGLQDKLPNEQPSPATNDVPFLTKFPFLARPHDIEHEEFERNAPKDHKGMLRQEKGRLDLGRELIGMGGRDVRLRYWLMAPDGVIRFHQHSERPAIVYLLSGSVEEYKWGIEGKQDIKAGEMTREAADTEHYWLNKGQKAVQMAAVDLVDSFSEGIDSPAPQAQPVPNKLPRPNGARMGPFGFDVTESEANARTTSKLAVHKFKDLPENKKSLIELRDSVPHLAEAYHYVMRGREITVKPGEMIPLQRHAGRPGLTYICDGVIIEHRDDRKDAVPLRPGDHTFNTNGVNRWLINTTSADVVLFEVDFLNTRDKNHQ